MHSYTRKLQIVIFTLCVYFAFTIAANAQSVCPSGMICLTQAEANAARDNALELVATKAKVDVLNGVITEKDKTIAEVKKTAADNEADLRKQNTDLLTNVAEKTGQLIKCDAFAVRDAALIEFLVKNQRSKQNGVINIKLGGN